jgi:ABC-type tungstate transport system substrate-binding protein
MNSPLLAVADPFAGFGVLLIIAGLIFALVWICFPFTVSSKLNRLIEVTEYQTRLLETIAKNTAGPEDERTEAPPAVRKSDDGWKKTLRGG